MIGLLAQAFRELKADRFRTLLSLLGVAVGIFSIVAALTLVDSLQKTLREGFAAYGNDLLFVEREPLEPDLNEEGVFRWWDYASRPPVTWREYRFLAEQGENAFSQIAFAAFGRNAVGVEGDWRLLVRQPLSSGRGFTPGELEGGAPVAVVGADVEAGCGDKLWIDGIRCEVIGVFEKAGLNAVSPIDIDRARLIPRKALSGPVLRGSILLDGADPQRVRALMRRYRRLSPLQPDDFSLNRISFLLEEMNDIFALAARLGWIVGLFSLLAGGFGIANMLYVSVEERRPQIGICRALGARRRVIAGQFLREAVILSLLGAAAGIGLVALLVAIQRLLPGVSLQLSLSLRAVLAGTGISTVIGLLFGAAPAHRASRLSPVEAMAGRPG